jgi:folate-binding protein YgfZ
MAMIAELPARGVIEVAGADRVSFLNGLVSNDVGRAAPGQAVWAALLTAQGRYLADFFIYFDGERLLLETQAGAVPGLISRLNRFRLRAAVRIEDVTATFKTYAVWHGMPPEVPVTAPDPRLHEAGYRLLCAGALQTTATAEDYALFRLGLGLPDGPPDLEPEKTLLLEAGFDELNGIDWQKGCYMGQELTARTKYRGLVKRRLVPVTLDGALPPPGTPVVSEGMEVGTVRSGSGRQALATLRLDALGKPLNAEGVRVSPSVPVWMKLPA